VWISRNFWNGALGVASILKRHSVSYGALGVKGIQFCTPNGKASFRGMQNSHVSAALRFTTTVNDGKHRFATLAANR
jgi:hypothetical protein